jgi:hypothetical protein
MGFAEYLYRLMHIIFKRGPRERSDADALARALGPEYDLLQEAIFIMREQALVATAGGRALDALGAERGIRRWMGEPDDHYRRRLLAAYRTYASDGTRAGMLAMLRVLGYPEAEVHELYRDGVVSPLFDGHNRYDGTIVHSGGVRWAEFRVKAKIEEDRSFTAADLALLLEAINNAKPAHTKLAELVLDVLVGTEYVRAADEVVVGAATHVVDPFLRAGLRHSGGARYQKVLAHDAAVRYGGSGALHNRQQPGALVHRCDDEAATVLARARLRDEPRIWAAHDHWPRAGFGRRYGVAPALDLSTVEAGVRLADAAPQTADASGAATRAALAERFGGEVLAHGVPLWPRRNGAVPYRSRYPHRPRAPRDGTDLYGDRLPRLLGPRRDGRHRYGGAPQEKLEGMGIGVVLYDRPVTGVPGRNGRSFYRDGLRHGPCPAPLESPGFDVAWRAADDFGPAGDGVSGRVRVAGSDGYPGRSPVHGSPEQPVHDGRIRHGLSGTYGWRGDRHDGRRYHGRAPVDGPELAGARLSMQDAATGHHLYGGMRLRHDGGGLRWKHHGMLLRRPFAIHDARWVRDGTRRYLEARARYGDLAVMHDGVNSYGISAGLHDGSILRRPAVVPEEMTLVLRRGYRRLTV